MEDATATAPKSPACQDLCDAAAGMSLDEITGELAQSDRVKDPDALARYLLSMAPS